MDLSITSSANISPLQWPLNLYTNLNPADNWRRPIAPGNPVTNLPVAQGPQSSQNNTAMLTALNDVNWQLMQTVNGLGALATSEQALQTASQNRIFADETIVQAMQTASKDRILSDETMNQLRLNQIYNQNGNTVIYMGALTGQISLLI